MTKESVTIFQLCSQWKASIRFRVKPTTYAVYVTMIEKHILPELGNYQVQDLNNQIVEQYLQKKRSQELSWSTLRLIVFILKGVLHTGEEDGIRTAERLHCYIPQYKRPYMHIFKQENTNKLFHCLEHSEGNFEMGMLISICTGIRVGELCGLQWGDVNWGRGTIQINRTVSRIRNPETEEQQRDALRQEAHQEQNLNMLSKVPRTIIYIGPPKTGTSIREIPLPDFLILKMTARRGKDNCYILTGAAKCMEPRGVQRRFKNLLRKCNIPDTNIHSLRHSFASRWIENGFDNKALSEILGHSSIKITMDIYVHSDIEQKKVYINHMI